MSDSNVCSGVRSLEIVGWRCAPTPQFQAISRLNSRSIPTQESFMPRRWATQHSAFATGSRLNQYSQNSTATNSKPVTIYSLTLHFHQKWREHSSTPTKQLQTLSPSKPTRRIPKQLLPKPHQCQYIRLRQHQQYMVHLQTQWTQKYNSSL